MLKNGICGVNTGHKTGFVYRADKIQNYLLMVFHSPFFIIKDGERIEGRAGDAVIHRPGSTVVHGPITKSAQFVNYWIFFSDDDGIVDTIPLCFDTPIHLTAPAHLSECIAEIRDEMLCDDTLSLRLIDGAIYKMLSILSRTATKDCTDEKSVLAEFSEARLHILNNLSKKWTLDEMSVLTGYSVSRFSALYNEFFGKSPMKDLLDRRVSTATQLLSLHVYKIGDVAKMCGFSSMHYFSEFIRKHTGRKPSDF